MNETENYLDQEIEFTYEGQDYIWMGDYTIETYGEDESEYAPSYWEFEVKIYHTSSLASCEDGLEITPTHSLLAAVEFQIERNL